MTTSTIDAISERLMTERNELQSRAAGVKRTAAEQNRDLNEGERESLKNFRARITAIDEQLEITTADYEIDEKIASNLRKYGGAHGVRAENPWEKSTPGQVLWDYLHRRRDREADTRIESFNRYSTRAAEHMGTTAANTAGGAGRCGGNRDPQGPG